MTTGFTYRNLLALVFLALFAFITLPVQVWHSHSGPSCKPVKITHTGKKAAAEGFSEKTTDSYCSICAHHYPAYTAGHQFRVPAPEIQYRVPAAAYACQLPCPPTPGFSNKGPPALA